MSLGALVAALGSVARDRHDDMVALVSGLPAGALTWTPAPAAAHLSGLAMHIVAVEEHAARTVAGLEVAPAPGNGSGMESALDEAALVGRIREADRLLAAAIEGLAQAAAEDAEAAERAAGAAELVEECDHAAMHYGQMQLTRHLWEAAHPGAPAAYEHWR
jgi:hypothetical protein